MGEYRWDELITYSPFALVAGRSAEWLWPSWFPLRHLLNPESWKHWKSEPKSSVSWYWGDHVKWKKRITQLQALLGVFRPRWSGLSRLWASLGHPGSGRGPNRSSKAKYRPQSQAPSLSHISSLILDYWGGFLYFSPAEREGHSWSDGGSSLKLR